ncbi:MAG TPA: aminotransferase class V-fold PLP-dependent enzyme, partial [Beijerinckiaceae bacterium]
MARERVYLDWNATSPLTAAARAALVEALATYGNPSSVHAEGRAARAALEAARAQVAALAGAAPERVVFTSGGTEAANHALAPGLLGADRRRADVLVACAAEHVCVLEGSRFPARDRITAPVDARGVLDLDALAATLRGLDGRRPIVALQAVNNETGVLQPVAEAAALTHAAGGLLVCDAVQAAGRIDASFAALDADALVFSAHKIGGPKGVGALVLRDAASHIEEAQIRGGGQERGLR